METYEKKRIEIILEAPALPRLERMLQASEATGYTVLPALSGYGTSGTWSRAGAITDAERMVVVVCVLDPGHADAVLQQVFEIIEHRIGLVTVSSVEVIRRERF